MTARKGLRAKVSRTRLTPLTTDSITGVPQWEYLIHTPGAIVVYGTYDTLEQAHDDAAAMVRSLLEIRQQGYSNRGLIDTECPDCGDPCEYHQYVSPGGGIQFSYDCASCGLTIRDGA